MSTLDDFQISIGRAYIVFSCIYSPECELSHPKYNSSLSLIKTNYWKLSEDQRWGIKMRYIWIKIHLQRIISKFPKELFIYIHSVGFIRIWILKGMSFSTLVHQLDLWRHHRVPTSLTAIHPLCLFQLECCCIYY